MSAKKDIKVSVFLDEEMAAFIDETKAYGMKRSDYMRSLVWEEMKFQEKKRKRAKPSNDPFSNPTINGRLIPDDLKDVSQLILEWWPIRHKKKATCSRKVAERIFDKLRTFTPKDRKTALEGAIAGGWRNIYERKQFKNEKESQNIPKPKYFKASENKLPPTLQELGFNKAIQK